MQNMILKLRLAGPTHKIFNATLYDNTNCVSQTLNFYPKAEDTSARLVKFLTSTCIQYDFRFRYEIIDTIGSGGKIPTPNPE
jgi:hypothetical protein